MAQHRKHNRRQDEKGSSDARVALLVALIAGGFNLIAALIAALLGRH
jgi:hypothetical protein